MSRINENLNPLLKVDYTKLTQEQIIDDIRSLLEIHPLYKTEWQDFLDSNAGQMLVQTFAYIASRIILRADFIANELFLPTARDPKSIINILKLIGYNLKPPTGAVVPVLISSIDNQPITVDIPPGYLLTGEGLDNTPVYFEICAEENDYDTILKMENETSKVFKAYAGLKKEEIVKIESKENFSFTLTNYPVIDGSIKIYINQPIKLTDGTYYQYEKPLEEITSLLLFGKDSLGRPRYVVSYDEQFKATIKFGRENYGGAWSSIIDGLEETYVQLRVVYRVGGGYNSNIIKGGIDTTVRLNSNVTVKIVNIEGGVGGSNGETIYESKLLAPLTTKTVNKTVTPEDYIVLLRRQNLVKILNVAIDSPYENPQRVPYLFNYIYLSPQRNWDSFSLEEEDLILKKRQIPKLLENESVESYQQRFQIRLNNFLNLQGCCDDNYEVFKNESLNIIEKGVSNESLFYPDPNENLTEYTGEAKILYYSFLQDKKITGIENIFRIANFKPFRIEGNLYYKKGYNPMVVKEKIIQALRNKFALENLTFNNSIKLSEIYGLVHSFIEVAYFQIIYPTTDLQSDGLHEIIFLLPENVVKQIPIEVRYNYDISVNMFKA